MVLICHIFNDVHETIIFILLQRCVYLPTCEPLLLNHLYSWDINFCGTWVGVSTIFRSQQKIFWWAFIFNECKNQRIYVPLECFFFFKSIKYQNCPRIYVISQYFKVLLVEPDLHCYWVLTNMFSMFYTKFVFR